MRGDNSTITTFTDVLRNLCKDFKIVRTEFKKTIRQETGIDLGQIPSYFGYQRYQGKRLNKRITLDLYATGQIVFYFDEKLTVEEKASRKTTRDFLDPVMKQNSHNHFSLYQKGQLDILIKKINEHFK